MTVYVVLLQPDLDWDHKATFLGVFSSREKAEKRRATWKYAVIIEATMDVVTT